MTKLKQSQDWHKADIKAALEKAGTNLHQIGAKHGYAKTSAYDVLRTPSPKLERLVASILNLDPWQIWPSRYDHMGRPISSLRFVRKS